ncbi:MAG: hypothetical protein NZ959_08375, partial [Armatimonadetes bacterium]|nr:hypothetical protein [Armatimonadota bacterium]
LVLAAAPSFVFLAHSLSSLTAVLFPKATDPAQRFLVSFFFFFTGSLVILPSFIIAIFTWALISITGAVFLFHLVNAIISVVIISWAGRVLSRLEPTE